MAKPILILACDGGGMRGLITSLLLQDLESKTSFLTNVDVFAGTSTGSFIALGLASGKVQPADLVALYEKDGQSIFAPYTPPSGQASPALRQAMARSGAGPEALSWNPCNWVSGFCNAMYMNDPSSPLYTTLSTLFNGSGPALTLADLPKQAVVTTNMLWSEAQQSWFPALLGNLPNMQNTSMPVVDAALSSGAAPIYFPPFWNATLNTYCADGGTFANNPASVAVTAALQAGVITPADLPNVYLLSLNTGVVRNGMTPDYINTQVQGPQNMGILDWFLSLSPGTVPSEALISLIFDTVSSIDTIQMQALLGGNFVRPQGPVLTAPYALDDWADYQTLVNATNAYISGDASQPGDWSSVVSWVKSTFT
ncbi:MAG TPA: patatin-like phospholipase family protein [Longimicrobium sp.]|nr:patatin-like phospholipase family protein [Longimicrobium sp.]